MGASEARLSLSQEAVAERFKQDQMLLRAIYKAQQVVYNGKLRFIQGITTALSGGDVETIVYLSGSADQIPASEITLAPEIS